MIANLAMEAYVRTVYCALCIMRWIFLSGRTGVYIHNAVYYRFFRVFSDPQHSQMVARLRETLEDKYTRIASWQERVYRSHPRTVRHALMNIFVRRFVVGSFVRRRLAKSGQVVPHVVMVSVNTPEAGCNLACDGCYAFGHENTTIDPVVLRKVIEEQELLRIYHVMFLGGEPLLYKGLMSIMAEYPNTSFYVATNGTMLTPEVVQAMTAMGNVCPMISLEGLEEQTDLVRGAGVFRQVTAAMWLCAMARLPYTVTVTVTKRNLEEVMSDRFLRFLDAHRCCGVSYSCYVPIGRSPRPGLQLSIEESEQLEGVREYVFNNFAMFPTVGRNGIARVTDCFAANQYFHVLPNGQVEACPFVQWADPSRNMASHTILEITSSPLFQGIRELNRQGIPGVTGCQAPRLEPIRDMFARLGAESTTQLIQIRRRA